MTITPQVQAAALLAGLSLTMASAAEPPQAQISNGQLAVKMFLPDAKDGYYRSTRFDWSGAVNSVSYKGHEFYGPWYDKIDPAVINWVFRGGEIVTGPCSGLYGPVDEFETVLGWTEAKPGGTFVKIGVGALRKGGGEYNRFAPYEVLNSGNWTMNWKSDSVAFTQELSDPASGYAYLYRKVVRLTADKPQMVLEHSLKNTGKRAIDSAVYNHNFVVLDKQAPGPDFTFKVPYQIQPSSETTTKLAAPRGNQVVYAKQLSGEDEAVIFLPGFSADPKDAEIVIENRKAGAGVKITNDRPLSRSFIWSIRTVLAVEPYTALHIEPGAEFTWKSTFDYYLLR